MLFNSYVFIFLFLPVTLGVFFTLGRLDRRELAMGWLVLASLFFYGWWNPAYVGLILVSMIFNYQVGLSLGHSFGQKSRYRSALLGFGVCSNLALLGYYKYANFFMDNLEQVFQLGWHIEPIALPLGISFFTFTQIAYLVDAYQGEVREYNAIHYGLFVTYFPHLIAGPVLHHKEMMPQFGDHAIYRFDDGNFAAGLSYFVLGLVKKVIIADGVAGYSNPVFQAAARGEPIGTGDAWGGALAYTFQLYFDFSGYSDMAIGLALMMGVHLPLNFDSPYKAVNIADFWRRWHMTLSRFLRNYIYISLGGNRNGKIQRYTNLMTTMLLGGLWHGAGWTFLFWGGLHGLYLVINHAWHGLRRQLGQDPDQMSTWWGRGFGRAITFLVVVVGWVLFRAEDHRSAERILSAMFLSGELALSPFYAEVVTKSPLYRWIGLSGLMPSPEGLLLGVLSGLYLLVLLAPNTQQIMRSCFAAPGQQPAPPPRWSGMEWRPSVAWVLVLGAAGLWILLGLSSVSQFLYFQF